MNNTSPMAASAARPSLRLRVPTTSDGDVVSRPVC